MKHSTQKITYTNNFIGEKSIRILDEMLDNYDSIRCIKELNLVNFQHFHSAVAKTDLSLLTKCLVGKQLRSLNIS